VGADEPRTLQEDFPDQAGSPTAWRGILFWVPIFLWTLGGAGVIGIAAALSPSFRGGGYVHWVRRWGRVPLWMCGASVEVHGREHAEGPGPRLLLFNHVSLLDLYMVAALCPERALVLYKKEFARIPGLGLALRHLGMIPVDRTNREAAIKSITEAGRRILAERATCVMAPEGTRSREGGLQRFKMGAFHLAAEHSIPIVPMIMRGIESILPMGSFLLRNGHARVDLLPPIDTSGWKREQVHEHAEELRALFLEYLPPAPGSETADQRMD
jgi:1-acyl-sn-glycerol-3-phosphate acyltransferase